MHDILAYILKLILSVFLIPWIICFALSFHEQLLYLKHLYPLFVGGIIAYLVIHLFVYAPVGLFQFGQNIVGSIFHLSEILTNSIPYILPFYLTLLLITFYVTEVILRMTTWENYFLFLIGMMLAMHIILSARELYELDTHALKPNYFFYTGLIFILNLITVSLVLGWVLPEFSAVDFLKASVDKTIHIYTAFYKQLFL